MNRIYSKIWNRALNQLVVASELARNPSGGKTRTRHMDRVLAHRLGTCLVGAAGAIGSLVWTTSAQAQVSCANPPYNAYAGSATCAGLSSAADSGGATAIGYGAHSAALNSVTVGFQAYSTGINSIYLGARTAAGTGALADSAIAIGTDVAATATGVVAIGTQAKADQSSAVVIGTSSKSIGSGGSVAIGIGSNATTAPHGVAIGYNAAVSNGQGVAVGSSSVATGEGALAAGLGTQSIAVHSTAVGFQAYASALNAVYLGARTVGPGASAESAIGIGTDVSSSGLYAIGMGFQAQATQADALAIGRQATATGINSIYVGALQSGIAGSGATANNAIAVGTDVTASGVGSVAMGNFTVASGTNSVALGTSSATASAAVAIGRANVASATNALALGFTSLAQAASTIAIGDTNTVAAAAGAGAIAGGHNSQVLGGTGAVAFGEGQTANGNGAVAIGDPNSATGNGAVAVGANNTANGDGAVAQGNGNNAQGVGSVAIGNTSGALGAGSVALGNTATANNANDVALGSGSTTAAAVGTAGTTINGVTYTFQGITPGSTVSVGSAGAERTITNVAAGRIDGASTDAINGSQLFATNQAVDGLGTSVTNLGNTVTNLGDTIASTIGGGTTYDPATGNITTSVTYGGNTYSSLQQIFNQIGGDVSAGAVHYFSVNDNGTPGANYANDGATGLNALAAGVGATATADNATALGQGTGVSVLGGVALGSGAVSDRAIAPDSGSITAGTHVIPFNTTDRTLRGAVSVGNATDFRQVTNVADGTEDQDAVTLRQLKGALTSFAVTPLQYFHANSTATDSAAVGQESVAIGPQTTVNGDNGIGMGNGAIVQATAPGGIAIGQNATTNLADGLALGNNATSNGIQAIALGTGAQAAFAGSVALGAGSVTDAAVGTSGTTINGTSYAFAGTTPGSTVSVGAPGAERTITNVAAGRVDGGSTDAINGSQLFAATQAIGTVGTSVTNLGNTVTNLGNTVTNLGDSIAGGIGGGTTYDPATGQINTSINYAGNTYSSIQQIFDQIGTNGIKYFHANSNLADSIANGVNSVAIGPVSTANTENAVSIGNGATAGSNVGDVALGAGSTTAPVVQTGGGIIAGTTYTYAGATPGSTVSVGAPGAERTITNVAAGRIDGGSTDAVNGSQLYATNQAIDALNTTVINNATHYYSVNDNGVTGGNYDNNGATGLNAVASGVGSTATAQGATALGQGTAASVLGGVALGSGAVSDRAIAPASGSVTAGTHVIPYNTTDRTLLGAVSVGNATDFRQITNVADGTEDQDAVTLRQLKGSLASFAVTPTKYFHANSAASDSAAVGAESVAVGPETTVNGDNGIGIGNHAIVQQTAPGGIAVGQDSTANLADGVALGTGATSNGIQALALGAGSEAAYAGSVALGSGSETAAAVGTANTTVAGVTYNFAGSTPGSTVSVGAAGAERTITNLAAGRIGELSTDAINGSQLFATNASINALYSELTNLSNTINNLPAGGGGTTNNTYQTSPDNTSTASAGGNNSTAAGAGSSATGDNSTAVGAGSTATGDNSVAIGAGSVANGSNTVSVGSVGHERTVTNVAAGVNPTDAVNVGQLDQAIDSAKNWTKDYVDQRFQSVDRDLNRIGNRANAGIASAMAMASLPQAYQPNQNAAAVSLGSFHGETGIAVGMSTVTESGRYVFKLNATTNSRGDAGAGVGAAVVW
jgi:autotransporter adhesin